MGIFDEVNIKIIEKYTININGQSRQYLKCFCSKHGEFESRADWGCKCKKCKREKAKAIYDEKWKNDCSLIHDNKYDYTNTDVGNVLTHSLIYCNNCGNDFKQTPASHKSGRGCPTCANKEKGLSKRHTVQDIIDKLKEIDGRDYEVLDEYISCKEKMKFRCDKGHQFETTVDEIFNANRTCPICKKQESGSVAERELYNIISQHYECEPNNRKVLGGKEIDIYIPSIKVGIEFNGIYWHTDTRSKISHKDKKFLSLSKGIRLIHIYEDDWRYKKEAVLNKLYDNLKINLHYYKHYCKDNSSLKKVKILDKHDQDLYDSNKLRDVKQITGYIIMESFGTIAICPYYEDQDKIILKDIVSCNCVLSNHFERVVTGVKKHHNKDVYIILDFDWIDDLKLNNMGYTENEFYKQSKQFCFDGSKLSEELSDKCKDTLTKTGFIIFKL